jgi:hypothetical protein
MLPHKINNIPLNKTDFFLIHNSEWPLAIDILFPNDAPIRLANLFLIFQHYLTTPYPFLIQVLSLTQDLKVSEDTYKDTFLFQSQQPSKLHKLNFSLFCNWFNSAWNMHLGYKTQYSNSGFRLIFAGESNTKYNNFLITYPWPIEILNKYGFSQKDLFLEF